MKFDLDTPDPEHFQLIKERGYERVWTGPAAPPDSRCVNCDSPTTWTLLNYDARFCCSHECADRLWTKYLDQLIPSLEEARISYEQRLAAAHAEPEVEAVADES